MVLLLLLLSVAEGERGDTEAVEWMRMLRTARNRLVSIVGHRRCGSVLSECAVVVVVVSVVIGRRREAVVGDR